MRSRRDSNRRYVVLAVLFVLGGLALAIVGELASSPLRQALQELPLQLAAVVVIALLAIAVVATIAYERLVRGAGDAGDPGAGGSSRTSNRSTPAGRAWRPSRRTVTGLTAVLALAGVGLIGATIGPRLFGWLASSVTAALEPPWTSESLHTFLRPVQTADDSDQAGYPTAVFSPDGTKLAASAYTHTVQIWDLESDRRTVLRAGKPPQQIAFSPDGDTLALVGNPGGASECGGTVELWDLETQRLVDEWRRPATLYAVAFSPDGKRFALGGKECESLDGVVEVWDTARRQRTQHFTHGDLVRTVAFDPDGDTLASAGGDQWDSGAIYSSIRLWDVERGGKPVGTLEHPANIPVDGFGFDPSGRLAVSAGTFWKSASNGYPEDGTSEMVTVWDAEPPRTLISEESENRPIDTLAVAPDGDTLAVARLVRRQDETRVTVELLRTRTLEKVESFEVESSSVHSMDFDASGRRLAIANDDGVELWTRRGIDESGP